jgi:histidinol phosphatase-like enzyme
MDEVSKCNLRMTESLTYGPNMFDAICMGSESSDDIPASRKPLPKLIVDMREKFDLLNERCYMIGDKQAMSLRA